jgi:sterol 3beta-glucosyltransferase
MKIGFATIGSRGDIQPILVVAMKFKEYLKSINQDHQFVFVTHRNQRKWIESFGFEFRPIEICIDEIAQQPELAELIVKGETMKFSKAMMSTENSISMFKDLYNGCQGCDVIVTSGTTILQSLHIAEKLKSKLVVISLSEMHPTGNAMPMFMGSLYFSTMNRMAHFVFRKMLWSVAGEVLNECRKSIELEPLKGERDYHDRVDPLPFFYAYSPSILPKPKDWPDNTTVGGFMFLDSNDNLEPNLDTFLSTNANCVYIGFGSMPAQLTLQFHEIVRKVIETSPTDWNFVVYVGSHASNFDDWKSNKRIFLLSGAPHDKLFPRCKVIVHHGGAGTTASSLRAGVPQVICSFFADQPFWARKMSEFGVGPKNPLKFSTISPEKLLKSIKEVFQPSYAEKAKKLGQVIKQEHKDSTIVSWLASQCF